MASYSAQWLLKHWLGQGRGMVVEIVIVDEFVIVDVGCTTAFFGTWLQNLSADKFGYMCSINARP
jgi:hypothetical protein